MLKFLFSGNLKHLLTSFWDIQKTGVLLFLVLGCRRMFVYSSVPHWGLDAISRCARHHFYRFRYGLGCRARVSPWAAVRDQKHLEVGDLWNDIPRSKIVYTRTYIYIYMCREREKHRRTYTCRTNISTLQLLKAKFPPLITWNSQRWFSPRDILRTRNCWSSAATWATRRL